MNIHWREEMEFGSGPILWDATPGVCCAAAQLGACAHSEVQEPEDDYTIWGCIAEMAFQTAWDSAKVSAGQDPF